MRTFLNPVHPHSFPDPYVLKHDGTYWGFSTGRAPDGRCFGVATSPDLVDWTARPGAMEPLPGEAPCYWAPEVVRVGSRFYLYYSVGNEDTMEIRVAEATHPGGPYADCGRALTTESFAIDPHVFEDEDGTRWLFYATDFLEHTHVGTGTVRDRLLDPLTLEGRPRPVTRPHHDWQVYDPQRKEKGGVRWHTVEGPFVLKHRGVYHQMFSGGNWKNVTYGVSYATAHSIEAPGEWTQHADGERVLPALRTIPGRVVGPGHNSVVRGPDNRQLFCVYHRWATQTQERVLCIDRLDWAGDRLLVLGPTDAPQPAPFPPTHVLHPREGDQLPLPAPAFLLHWRAGSVEMALHCGGCAVWTCAVEAEGVVRVERSPAGAAGPGPWEVRLELNGRQVRLTLEGTGVRWEGVLGKAPDALQFVSVGEGWGEAQVTLGFEDVFAPSGPALPEIGWRTLGPWSVAQDGLACAGEGQAIKEILLAPVEVVASARAREGGGYALSLAGDVEGLEVRVEREGGWRLRGPGLDLPLPGEGTEFGLLRLLREGKESRLWWEGTEVAALPALPGPVRLGLFARGAGAVFDSLRVTAADEEVA